LVQTCFLKSNTVFWWPVSFSTNMERTASEIDSIASEIATATKKLENVQSQLDQLDVLKAAEPTLRRDLVKYTARVAELRKGGDEEIAAAGFYNKTEEVTGTLEEKIEEARVEQDRDPEAERKSKIRAIKKKLQGIDKLKLKDDLDGDAQSKVANEPTLRRQLAALERGEDPDALEPEEKDTKDVDIDQEKFAADKLELQKQLKKLQKKVEQIDALKAKSADALDADGRAKIASEAATKKEMGAVEKEIGKMNKIERERVANRLGWKEEAKSKPKKK